MIAILAPLALTVSTGALLALPLTPALRELLSKRDAGPLLTRKDDGKIDNFARSLRARCEPHFGLISQLAELGVNEVRALAGQKIFIAGKSGIWQGPSNMDVLVLCAGPVQLPRGFHSLEDFFARDSVHAGKNNIFRALLSESDIVLDAGTQTLRWVHAQCDLVAAEDCSLFGRASAGRSIVLSAGCRFERMHAPVIYSSTAAQKLEVRSEPSAFSKLAQAGIGRRRIHDRDHLSAGEQHFGDLVCSRPLRMDQGASVFGSVKANGPIQLCESTEVDGSLVSTKSIHISSACFVKGPLIAEREIVIHSGVQIGLPGQPTTVSAPHIQIAPGSVLHGTVWARVEGRVGD